jgi:hypothetical protein
MKKSILAGLTVLMFASLACGASAPTQQVDSVSTIVAATMEAMTASAPQTMPTQIQATQAVPTQAAPTQAQSTGKKISFGNVSFILPGGVASDATGEQVAAVDETTGDPWDVAPAHIHFKLTGYNNTLGTFSAAEISVYPTQDYAAASNGAANSIPKLQAILASPSAPLTMDAMPGVPYFNAGQMATANIQRINFASGSGVRMVTQYGQAVGAIMNNGTFYHFQGLTSDGKYYVIAVLPIGSAILASGTDPNAPAPAGGVQFPGYNGMDPATYEGYYQAIITALNNNPNSFTPSLAQLDALVQSITVSQ